MGGLAPGLGPVGGFVLAHCAGTRRGFVPSGEIVGASPSMFPAQWQEGSKHTFLMVSTSGRLLVLGGNPLHGSDALDSRMGDCLWDLCLDKYTGDGKRRSQGKYS